MKRLLVLILVALLFAAVQSAAGQSGKATIIQAEPNKYAPEIYSEKLNLQVMLVNLPGVATRGSTWNGSCAVYFIPEGEIDRFVQSQGGIIDRLKQTDISNKVLLFSGSFKKVALGSDRVYEKTGVPFRQKVPDQQRTMLGKVVVFYSMKVYDARLEKTIYKDGSFSYSPFDRNNLQNARTTFHLSFFVNQDGKLYTSSLPRDKSSADW